MNLCDIAILNVNGADYCCIISGITKSEAINLMKNFDLAEKSRILKYKNLLSHLKIGKEILTFGDIEIEKKNFTAIKALFI